MGRMPEVVSVRTKMGRLAAGIVDGKREEGPTR